MDEQTRRVMHSSSRADWRTPPELFAALNREFTFTVDAAADAESALCYRWYGPGSEILDDALLDQWKQDIMGIHPTIQKSPCVFLNPPFSLEECRRLKKLDDPGYRSFMIENWAQKCWEESQRGCTIVGVFPFSPQTVWYRQYVYGHDRRPTPRATRPFHAAMEERRLPHRVDFLRPDGTTATSSPSNTVILVWRPNPGYVGPWQPAVRYWTYRKDHS